MTADQLELFCPGDCALLALGPVDADGRPFGVVLLHDLAVVVSRAPAGRFWARVQAPVQTVRVRLAGLL